jgi:hypothetical protein
MLKLDEKTRDSIVQYLSGISVPVSVAPNFLGIIDILGKLEKIEEIEK